MKPTCPFCNPTKTDVVLQNELFYGRYDRYPVGKGHLLIIPFRHVANFFSLTVEERQAAFALVWEAQARIESELHPDGFNVGVNIGTAGGQTVMHVHIHLIPRFLGDIPDPRGGVRFVIPEKAKYWQDASEGAKASK